MKVGSPSNHDRLVETSTDLVTSKAHVIRDHSTKQFKAACALTARHRWCVTGTPIQNRLEDLGALVRFLRVYPFDSISTFQTYIIKTIDKDNISGISKLRTLIKSIALRRTKDSVQDDLQPLPRINELCRVQLTSSERSLYDACRASALHIVDHSTGPEGKIRSFYNILQSILSLRQICSHGRELLSQRSLDRLQKFEKLGVMPETPDGATCELCADIFVLSESDISSQFAAVCLHIICAPCASIDQEGINEADRICPCCSNAALSIESIDTETTPKDSEMAGEEYRPSSKVQALLKSLRNSRITSSSDPIKR